MDDSAFELSLSELPFLARLRADELARVAHSFRRLKLGPAERLTIAGSGPEMVVVLHGRADVVAAPLPGQAAQTSKLFSGDHFGSVSLSIGRTQAAELVAADDLEVALLDRAGLEKILEEFPAVVQPLCMAAAEELRFKDGLIRELGEVEALGLTGSVLESAVAVRRRYFLSRGARVVRRAASATYRHVVVGRGREPPFWMLLGFIGALSGARGVVGMILKYHLEEHLFALVKGAANANPMHVHHFNYGLMLVSVSAVAAFLPWARQFTRILSTLFGIGAGLIFDEWALIWNLDPNYYQGLSYVAAASFGAILLQLLIFRRFWAAVVRQLAQWVRP